MHLSYRAVVWLLTALSVASPIEYPEEPVEDEVGKRVWMSYDNIDPEATSEAKGLLKYLQSQFGWHYISGQYDPASLAWVEQNIGKTPGILGNDFMDYSPSRIPFGASSHAVEDAEAFDSKGGINTFSWHWNAPNCLYNTASEPWYSGFYTAATCFNLQEALGEGINGANYQLLIRDIDAIAVQIKRLSDAGIPILFRPLHEPNGGWFWWGAQGSAAFKQLWDILYNRITDYHGLHNMVWVCNTDKPDWYPGNSKCDILSTDMYSNPGDHNVLSGQWNTLYSLSGGQRILALAEVGVIPDPELQASQNVPWCYWVTWGGSYIEDGVQNSLQFLYNVFSDSRVVTVDGASKLGSWKST